MPSEERDPVLSQVPADSPASLIQSLEESLLQGHFTGGEEGAISVVLTVEGGEKKQSLLSENEMILKVLEV